MSPHDNICSFIARLKFDGSYSRSVVVTQGAEVEINAHVKNFGSSGKFNFDCYIYMLRADTEVWEPFNRGKPIASKQGVEIPEGAYKHYFGTTIKTDYYPTWYKLEVNVTFSDGSHVQRSPDTLFIRVRPFQ